MKTALPRSPLREAPAGPAEDQGPTRSPAEDPASAFARAELYGHRIGSEPSPGHPLPAPVQRKMEKAFGADFSQVRIHQGHHVEQLGASAYTRGHRIHFAPGESSIHSPQGQAMLGHELAHVLQQRQGRARRGAGSALNEDSHLEAEADAQGAMAARGEPVNGGGGHGGSPSGAVQRMEFTEEQLAAFHKKQSEERRRELDQLNGGFVMGGDYQPGPMLRGALGLFRSRFDLSEVPDEHRDQLERAFSGASRSKSHNKLVGAVGSDLLGRMFRNVHRLRWDNTVRALANMTNPGSGDLRMRSDPTRAIGAENARLSVGVNRATAPHYAHESNSISLMEPSQLDQTSHELRHAFDQTHGELDLFEPHHRIASELNAFTQQDAVYRELTGHSPPNFENRSPTEMAKSYEGKVAKGYTGTLESSLEAVKDWHKRGLEDKEH
ncbi:DUF4157 domain-containing protein [Sorangium sp. So ce260]|uniref:eCIS core domain-containing protein n=1 Tax=Sorangium sp. So ce260 TaxID=3133291 RepID=UPI003F60F0EA